MGNGPHSQTVTGLATNELTTPSVKRFGLHSPFFARRTIFFATDIAMGASRSAIFNRFKASSKAAVMRYERGREGALAARNRPKP